MRADGRRLLALFVLAGAMQSALAADPSSPEATIDEAPPDLDFLEYLGTLVREGDAWIDGSDLRGPLEIDRDRAAVREQPPTRFWED
jgi:hypothetical protein